MTTSTHPPLLCTKLQLVCVALVFGLWRVEGVERFVDAGSTAPAPPYTNWAGAARTIQEAVDVALSGDEIIVTNGVYDSGGRAVDAGLTNRVAVTKSLTVRSVNGPKSTRIAGSQFGLYGGVSCRGVYLVEGAFFAGFTVTNCGTAVGWLPENIRGGGIYCAGSATVSNCVVSGNASYENGGGAYGGTFVDCVFRFNQAGLSYVVSPPENPAGGGVSRAQLVRCRVEGNGARTGGGAAFVWAENCLFGGNIAAAYGGGVIGGTLTNCTVVGNNAASAGGVSETLFVNSIVYNNGAESDPNHSSSEASFSCTIPMPKSGRGNIDLEPYVAAESGLLLPISPCINSGGTSAGAIDLTGNPRVAAGRVDMGATEAQDPWSSVPHYWLWSYGITPASGIDSEDRDQDGASTLQEWMADTNPTNRSSVFRISSITNHPPVTVIVQSSPNVSYWLEGTTNLSPEAKWTVVLGTLKIGTGAPIDLSDSRPTATQFYRAAAKRDTRQ